MIHYALYNTLHYSGFLCWPCKNGHSKHHFIRIFVYECGCQGYLYVFLLRTAPRSAQILIFKKNCSRAMILSRFSVLQRSASRFRFWLPELGFQKWSQQTPDFHIWNIFSPLAGYLVEDICFLASCSIYV